MHTTLFPKLFGSIQNSQTDDQSIVLFGTQISFQQKYFTYIIIVTTMDSNHLCPYSETKIVHHMIHWDCASICLTDPYHWLGSLVIMNKVAERR